MRANFTHIRITVDTQGQLNELKAPGQSYDGLLQELINLARNSQFRKPTGGKVPAGVTIDADNAMTLLSVGINPDEFTAMDKKGQSKTLAKVGLTSFHGLITPRANLDKPEQWVDWLGTSLGIEVDWKFLRWVYDTVVTGRGLKTTEPNPETQNG